MSAPTVCFDKIPSELKQIRQWVVWRTEAQGGKPTKVPYRADGRGKATSTDPATWAPFEAAARALDSGRWAGPGYVFSPDDPHAGVDLDKCRNPETGEIALWAKRIITDLGSYSEVSPSRTGVKVFLKGQLPRGDKPEDTRHKKTLKDGAAVELYDSGRYFTVTGQHLEGTPATIEDRNAELAALYGKLFPPKDPPPGGSRPAPLVTLEDGELIAKARTAKNGADFIRLWAGDTSGHGGDDSAADLALCNHLAFWTGRDASRMDSLFRQSGLYRQKWERADYRDATIKLAIDGCTEVYTPSQPSANGYGKAGTQAPASTIPTPDAQQMPPQRRGAFTADELLDADLPEAKWLVDGLITEGLVIMAGRPKMGKSWLALLLALTVGIGGVFLGQRVKRGRVVYFALEDSPKRLKRRMKSLGWGRGADVKFYFDLAPLGGTLAGLPAFIDAIQPDLVIVDTASRAMPAGAKTRDTNAVTSILAPVQQAAVVEACTVMLIDHYRKPQGMAPESVDHLEEILDSTAKVAVADTIIGLARKRGERGATLKITGRDLEDDVELAIQHNMATGCWELLGDASEVRRSERQRKVISALKTFNAFTASTTEIAERTGLLQSHTSEVLQELVIDGQVERLAKQGRQQPYRLILPNDRNNGNNRNDRNNGNNGKHSQDGSDGSDVSHYSHVSHGNEGRAPENSASVPLMITRQMEAELGGLGYTQEAVNRLTPQEAWGILSGATAPAPPAQPDFEVF